MNRIDSVFKNGNKVVIPYITLGDPNFEFTVQSCYAMCEAGADILEIGLPFSDPIADGPTIQASHYRALQNPENTTIEKGFECIRRVKSKYSKPIVFMGSTNLILRYGIEAFFKQAEKETLDGIILPDLSPEMALEYQRYSKKYNVPIIYLISPLCTEKRMQHIVSLSDGFLYVISSTGITGERSTFSKNLSTLIQSIKKLKNIPLVIGFGISTEEQVKTVTNDADGVIVGSHLVKLIESFIPNENQAINALATRVQELKNATL